jgi:hypothetical protein
MNVSNVNVSQQMVAFRQDILSLGADSYPRYSTLVEDFDSCLAETFNFTNGMVFTQQLDGFFNITAYQLLYENTVIRDETSGSIDRIMASITIARQLSSGRLRVTLFSEQRAVTLEQLLNAASTTVPENMLFFNKGFQIFEHLRVISTELLLGLSFSVVAIVIVLLNFTPPLICVLISAAIA